MLRDTLGVADTIHTAGRLDDGTPLDYAWGVRVFRIGDQRVQSHGGSWDDCTAKLVRLPDLGESFAALAADAERRADDGAVVAAPDELLSDPGS